MATLSPTKKRGFAAMDANRRREIARRGGKAAHERGTAHQFTSQEAQKAGRKGGKAVSKDRRHMARIGKKGGEASGLQRSDAAQREPVAVVHRLSSTLTPDGRRTLEIDRLRRR